MTFRSRLMRAGAVFILFGALTATLPTESGFVLADTCPSATHHSNANARRNALIAATAVVAVGAYLAFGPAHIFAHHPPTEGGTNPYRPRSGNTGDNPSDSQTQHLMQFTDTPGYPY